MDIKVDALSMHFDDVDRRVSLFENLSFEISSGERVAIIGASGVGKTTLLYLLGGLELPVSGNVSLGGSDLRELWKRPSDLAAFRGEKIGFVFQFHQLLPEFDAIENVAMPLLIRGESLERAHSRAKELLDRVGLSQRLHHRPGMLSGGEQQRVAVARALVNRPGVVLADEPTGSLDPAASRGLTQLLMELQEEVGITLVIATHSERLAGALDRVLELRADGLRSNPE